MLGNEDRKKIHAWNQEVPPTELVCIHDCIGEQFRKRPEAPAICAWDGNFSYEELDRHSSTLAVRLQKYGVQPDMFVPILLEKSRWVSVAFLAVLRAGGAFVFLDPSHPDSRLQYMCQTLQSKVIICSPDDRERGRILAETVVPVSRLELELCWTDETATCMAKPDSAAYAVFTSGSTGKPKGVVIEHANYATSGRSLAKQLHVSSDSRVLQFASHAFDVSVSDYLTTLMAGGCVCVPSEVDRLNDIPGTVDRLGVNWIHMTPSVARTVQPWQVPSIQVVVLSGEVMQEVNIQTWGMAVCLINAYGPAECSVDCVVNDEVVSRPNSIGTASAAVCWITDRHDPERLLPIGAVGELLVEGPVVGRGYLRNEEQTRKAFIPPPRWLKQLPRPNNTTSRLYRTGDLVQYLPDGAMRYIGRRDQQLKINGQRVELGEIEFHVGRVFPESQGAVVDLVLQPRQTARQILTAFVQWGEGHHEDAECRVLEHDSSPDLVLKARDAAVQLGEWLPRYMVPTRFIFVTRIPLTTSAKVDRSRLRQMATHMLDDKAGNSNNKSDRPLTVAEQQMQTLFAQVLGAQLSDIHVESDFFQNGGDSIKAMELVSRARREGLALTVAQILRSSTLAQLVKMWQPLNTSPEVKHVRDQSAPESINTHTLRSLPWHDLAFRERDVSDLTITTEVQAFSASRPQNYWFLELRGALDTAELRRACFKLVQRHAILRTVFVWHQDQTFQVVLHQMDPVISERETGDDDLRAVAEVYSREDARSQILYREPPLHFTLLRNSPGHHLLIMRLSHAQYDGLSIPVLMTDVMHLYQQSELSMGAPSFATYTRHCLRSQTGEALSYWRELLHGASMTLLPAKSENTDPEDSSAQLAEVTANLRKPNQPPGITIATVMKTAWSLAQARILANHDDIVFGQLVSGRNALDNQPDLSNVIGPCVNMIPVRVRLGELSQEPVVALMRRLQDQHAASMAFETISLGAIATNCTSWDPKVEFGSILHHRHAPDQVNMQFGELECRVDAWSPLSLPGRSIWLSSIVDDAGQLKLELFARSEIVSRDMLERLLKALCDILEVLDKEFSLSVENLVSR